MNKHENQEAGIKKHRTLLQNLFGFDFDTGSDHQLSTDNNQFRILIFRPAAKNIKVTPV